MRFLQGGKREGTGTVLLVVLQLPSDPPTPRSQHLSSPSFTVCARVSVPLVCIYVRMCVCDSMCDNMSPKGQRLLVLNPPMYQPNKLFN